MNNIFYNYISKMRIGGMWGLQILKDRNLASQIAAKIFDPRIAKQYNKEINKKDKDQEFLRNKVYNMIKTSSLIHDSYCCKLYRDSEPFPTQRKGRCFIGGSGNQFNCENNSTFTPCPLECRPKDHTNWIYC